MNARLLRHGLNWWPPLLFAGIHVTELSADYRHARVELRMRPWNRNYVGSHFGGSLFSMTDPFWMLLALNALGSEYFVWDRQGTIEFIKPGHGVVHADFDLTPAVLDEIRAATASGEKHLLWFHTNVVDANGEVVARIGKQLYVRRKPAHRPVAVEAPGRPPDAQRHRAASHRDANG